MSPPLALANGAKRIANSRTTVGVPPMFRSVTSNRIRGMSGDGIAELRDGGADANDAHDGGAGDHEPVGEHARDREPCDPGDVAIENGADGAEGADDGEAEAVSYTHLRAHETPEH